MRTSTPRKLHNRLAAHDIHTGKLKWHIGGPAGRAELDQAGTFFLGPPLPLAGRLYALAEVKEEIRLMVLDAASGRLLWSQQLAMVERDIVMDPLRRSAGASPSYADGVLICPTSNSAIVAVDPATRSLLWGFTYRRIDGREALVLPMASRNSRKPGAGWSGATATIVDGRVLVSPVESNLLYCLNLIDGKLQWEYRRKDALYLACVHQDKVVLVAPDEVRAISLSDTIEKTETSRRVERTPTGSRTVTEKRAVKSPKEIWKGGRVKLPAGSVPSGRGFLSGDRYFVPLSTAKVAAIDLASGKVTRACKSRKGRVPGNLICYKGRMLSQGLDGLEAYYQSDYARQQVERRLAGDSEDAFGLTLHGEILQDQGKQTEAIEFFRRAYDRAKKPRVRVLLRDALLEGLRSQFATYRGRAEEIEQLLDTPEQRATYLRLMAAGLQNEGDWRGALEQYLKLVDLDREHRGMERVTQSLSVRRSRWIQARLGEMRVQAADKAAFDAQIESRLRTLRGAADEDSLRRFISYFDGQPAAGEARRELIERLSKSGDLLEAELLLWQDWGSPDATVAATATAALADLLDRSNRPKDAALCYLRLRREFADVVCRDGKTGRELLDALPDAKKIDRLARPKADWPEGLVKGEAKATTRSGAPAYRRYPLAYRGDPAPFFSEITVKFDQSNRAIFGRDALGRQRWEASLAEASGEHSLAYNASISYSRVCAHLLLVSMGHKIMAIDTLGSTDSEEKAVLWHKDASGSSSGAALLRHASLRAANLPFGMPYHAPNVGTNSLGPVTSRYVCYQSQRSLTAADPLTGETLWQQNDLPQGSTLFGDDELVFAVGANGGEALVFRALDGKRLDKVKLPSVKAAVPQSNDPFGDRIDRTVPGSFRQTGIAAFGRRILVWRRKGIGQVLELFDPSQQKHAWPPRKFAAGARACLVDRQAIAVLQRDGKLVLISLPDGRTIVDANLKAEKRLSEIFAFRSGDQYVLVTHAPSPGTSSSVRRPQPLPGSPHRLITRGLVYSFDLEGKQMWPKPVSIYNQHVMPNQPDRLPVLTFACQVYDPSRRGHAAKQQVSVKCIDKRSGRVVHSGKFPSMVSSYELVGDPEKKTVELRLNRAVLRLQLTDEEIPPEAETDGTTGRALLDALRKGLMDAIEGSPDE